MMAAEPGEKRPVVVVDGRNREWDSNGSTTIADGDGSVREVQAVHDAQSLYLRLRRQQGRDLAGDPDHHRHRRSGGLEPRPA